MCLGPKLAPTKKEGPLSEMGLGGSYQKEPPSRRRDFPSAGPLPPHGPPPAQRPPRLRRGGRGRRCTWPGARAAMPASAGAVKDLPAHGLHHVLRLLRGREHRGLRVRLLGDGRQPALGVQGLHGGLHRQLHHRLRRLDGLRAALRLRGGVREVLRAEGEGLREGELRVLGGVLARVLGLPAPGRAPRRRARGPAAGVLLPAAARQRLAQRLGQGAVPGRAAALGLRLLTLLRALQLCTRFVTQAIGPGVVQTPTPKDPGAVVLGLQQQLPDVLEHLRQLRAEGASSQVVQHQPNFLQVLCEIWRGTTISDSLENWFDVHLMTLDRNDDLVLAHTDCLRHHFCEAFAGHLVLMHVLAHR
mmetsp:Transcript_71567/g.209780  ORF Transcript_71567/g.209780 Transcript_71567/m.209780 type:complete len:359 (+) Transcript_71567:57-1133(+)